MPFPIDPQYILATEQRLGATFPSMFKGKMMHENGGTIDVLDDDWTLYPFLDPSDKKRLARTCNDIILETLKMREWSNFPASAVAIATNGTADQLILLPKSGARAELDPAVCWWDHETGAVQKVADDVAELL